jgi:hypothetical protein
VKTVGAALWIDSRHIESYTLNMSVLKRSSIHTINKLLQNFPCVVILGARQVGKSSILKQIFPKARIFDLEDEVDFNRVNNSSKTFLESTPEPILIDEAQLCPNLFKALRVRIDQQRNLKGRFLLTGSSSPELLKNISESLAGRVAIFELDMFSWSEAQQIPESVFAKNITSLSKLKNLEQRFTQKQLLELMFYGQYPEPFLNKSKKDFVDIWMKNYIKTYIERDIRALFPSLQLTTFKRFISMLALSSGQVVNLSDFAKSLDVSQPTIKNYIQIAEGTFIWRNIGAYQGRNLTSRIIKAPKGHLRDSGLINYFLKLKDIEQMQSSPQFGRLWEVFIIEQLIREFNNANISNEYLYCRTQSKAEIDLIIEGDKGIIPIEIKSGRTTDPRKLIMLKDFINKEKCPYGILINNGDEVFMIDEKIIQIPAVFL